MLAHALGIWLAQIPNPHPEPPPGSERILGVLDNAKWGAGVSLMLGFFVGLIVWVGGRWVDHHRAGKVGIVMMLCAIGGAILYGIGWTLISSFAGG
ncbi:hypothetical protein FPZ12_008010 [Amycolatopsis acidicola]|uniref:Uncharacterized protein n=1 Tax=Amycolatopsis acidicola TaxID=2596893 RepID=A0A5N0VC66_9PSEU|nr:hypothetical protein [Amycolatopsis acidicola]KAA9163966.1 hypothetical protein FPZ12_008010 [Amycolatopsis acidicola]